MFAGTATPCAVRIAGSATGCLDVSEPAAANVTDLEQLLATLEHAAGEGQEPTRLEDIIEAIGGRSFAPVLLLIGVLIASPLSGVPGFPTLGAGIVLLVGIQMLVGRRHFWLPRWLLRRSVPQQKMSEAIDWLKRPARAIDRLLRPRLTSLVLGPGRYMIALTCLVIASTMPFLELIPFSSSAAGVALSAFGLALVAHDGVLALLAYIVTGLTAWLIVMSML